MALRHKAPETDFLQHKQPGFDNWWRKFFSSGTTITNNFSITSGSRANLGFAFHSAGTLTLGDVLQPGGLYGSTASFATYKIEAYFGTTALGVINVSSGSLPSSWIGNTSADWNTPSNWFNETIPTSSTDVRILSSAENQPVISGTTTAVCNSLTISSGASLTIDPAGKATVTELINNGALYLNSDANGVHPSDKRSYIGNDANIELFLTGGVVKCLEVALYFISCPEYSCYSV
jgi:hypothetical protein